MHTCASRISLSGSRRFFQSRGIYMDCVMGCCNLDPFHKLQTPIFCRRPLKEQPCKIASCRKPQNFTMLENKFPNGNLCGRARVFMIELLIALDSQYKKQVEKLPLLLHINLKFISLIKAKHAGRSRLIPSRKEEEVLWSRVPSSLILDAFVMKLVFGVAA